MAYVASVLAPHHIGLGISINSACENKDYVGGSDPTCCPAYRDVRACPFNHSLLGCQSTCIRLKQGVAQVPWAAVLTDMGTYQGPGSSPVGWMKNGTQGSCPYSPSNDPTVIQHCGYEGNVMNSTCAGRPPCARSPHT